MALIKVVSGGQTGVVVTPDLIYAIGATIQKPIVIIDTPITPIAVEALRQ